MPWMETDVLKQRMDFVTRYEGGGWQMTELCDLFGISRKTGYKYLQRYREDGVEGLRDRSRAPLNHPNRTSPEAVAALLRLRKRRKNWGAKKILKVLARKRPDLRLPARSTVEELFDRAGLVKPRKRRRKTPRGDLDVPAPVAPNDEWATDFKGWFRTGSGKRCDPLTVTDLSSRYALVCAALPSQSLEPVKARFQVAFEEYGLPCVIRSDNGTPFASTGFGGFTRLSVWWLHLGIRHRRIRPGCPQDNGSHERFHRTLKDETVVPPKVHLPAQQRAFTIFRRDFNDERPHEGIGMRTPAELYSPSPRQMPSEIVPFEYPMCSMTRMVDCGGHFKWQRRGIFLGEAFAGEQIGLNERGEDTWDLYLADQLIGVFNERAATVLDLSGIDAS